MIHFILATFVEAKPIIEYFNLKKKIGKLQFDIFQSLNKRISLTVSGIGKIEAVAAVIYTNMYFGGLRNNVWINVGIAGHENHEIGEIFIISKNEDFATKKRYFPSINFKSNLASINCITYDLPDSKYSDSLSDMELSGFYHAASKSSSTELIHSLKIVSDNKFEKINFKNKNMISNLIKVKLNIIEDLCIKLIPNFMEINELGNEINLSSIKKFKSTNKQKKEFLYLRNKLFILKDYKIIKSMKKFDSLNEFLIFLKDKIK